MHRSSSSNSSKYRQQRIAKRRGSEHDDGVFLLVFGPGFHLIAGQLRRNDIALAVGFEVQRAPVDRDLAAADAKKASEIDHRCPHAPVPIDDYIDDPAHTLIGL